MALSIKELKQRVVKARQELRSAEIAALNTTPLKQARRPQMSKLTAHLNDCVEQSPYLSNRILVWFGDAETGEYYGFAEYDPR